MVNFLGYSDLWWVISKMAGFQIKKIRAYYQIYLKSKPGTDFTKSY